MSSTIPPTGAASQGPSEPARDPAWDLIPAYALDAVHPLERRAVERLLADDEDARHELATFRATAAALVPDIEPPAALRAGVLDRVAALAGAAASRDPEGSAPEGASGAPRHAPDGRDGRGDDAAAPVVSLDAARRRRRRWSVAGIAAAAVVAIGIPTGIAINQSQQRSDLEAQQRVVAQLLADPDAHLATSDVSTGGHATVVVADGQALFTASGLTPTGGDKDYQLWRSADGKTMVSAGVLTVHDGHAATLVDAPDDTVFAVTVEPAGGSKQPTTDPVVALTVPAT